MGCHFLLRGQMEPASLVSLVLQVDYLPLSHEGSTGDNLRWSNFTDAEREAQGLKNTQVAGSHLGAQAVPPGPHHPVF